MNQPATPRFRGTASSVLPAASPAIAGFVPAALTLAVATAFLGASEARAQPSGHQAIHGTATLNPQGSHLVVTTQNGPGTQHSAINWQSFSVPGGSTTHFQQPHAASLSINRVVGSNPSAVFGTLSSNGRLVLVNPAGIAVGAGAVVDTAGFTASTLRMSDADALAGRLVFGGDGLASGALSVDGTILARGGDVVLIGTQVQVESGALVQAPNGATALAAGQKVALTGRGLEGIRLELQAPSDQALNLGRLEGDAVGIFAGQLKHQGLINAVTATAEGGKVVLKGLATADIAGQITASRGGHGGQVHATASKVILRSGALIDVSGEQGGGEALLGGGWQGQDARITHAQQTTMEAGASIRADAIASGNGGTIVAWSDGATRVHGSLSARGGAASGNGGNIETSGHYLDMQGQVDTRAPRGATGNLLLDPTDIFIATDLASAVAAGMAGTDQTAGPGFTPAGPAAQSLVTVSDLQGYLSGSNVMVQTTNVSGGGTGFIQVIDGVTWSSGNALGLMAESGISINAPITAGAGTLALSAGGSGAGGAITQAGSGAGISVDSLYAYTSNVNGGSITLTGAGNSISSIGAFSGTGGISVTNNGDLTVGSVYSGFSALGSIAGVSANAAQPVNLTVNGGSLKVADSSNGVRSAGGNITLVGTTVKVFGSPVNANGGNVSITGSGTGALHSVEIVNNGAAQSQVSTTGSGTITIAGNLTGGGAAGSAGVSLVNSTVSAGSGAVTLTGDVGWPSGVAQVSRGVHIGSLGSVSGAGNISVTGRAGGSASANSAGLEVGSGASVASSGGNVALSGTLNNPSILAGAGLRIAGLVQSASAGQVTLSGSATVGGSAGTGVDVASTASVTAGLGGLTVTGSVSSSTTATFITGTSLSGSASSSGNIAITGTANAPSAPGVYGVSMGGSLAATGAATITITGSGVPAPAPASYYDVYIAGTTIGSAGGQIKLVGDRINISSAVNSGTGRTMIVPFSASRPITLAGSSEPSALNLQPAELNLITASTIVVGGSSYTGGISIGNTGGTVNPLGTSALSLISAGSITQTAALKVSKLNADGSTVMLTNAGNEVDQLSGRSSTGAFQFAGNKATLTVGTVDGIAGIASSGNAVLVQNTGDISLTQAIAGAGSGNTVVLAGQHFSNTVGAGAINPGAGRWLVYSTTPSSNAFGGLVSGNNAIWNASHSGNPPATIASGNRYVFSAQPTVSVTATAQTKVYDATAGFATPTFTTSGLVDASFHGSVFLQDTLTGALEVASPAKDVGSYSIVQGTLGAPTGYLFGTYTGASATVTAASLMVTGVTASDKVYDTTAAASLAGTAGVTPLGSDVVSVSGTGTGLFADKNVGTGKAVTVSGYTLSGSAAGNYVLVQPSGLSADITPASLTVSGISADNKVYDATAAADLNTTGAALTGLLGSDSVSLDAANTTGSFADKNVGTSKSIGVSVALSGPDSGNYTVSNSGAVTADITAAALTVSGVAANNKVYDATTVASFDAGSATLTGVIGGDAVSVSSVSGSYADRNVGTAKAVTVAGVSLGGTDAGNYILANPSGLSADITPASLTVSGITANDKVYDTTTLATLAGTAGVTALGADVVTVMGAGTASFADKHVGAGKTVTVGGYSLGGADAGNYVVVQPSGLSADITPAGLTVSGVSVSGKVYDATTAAALTGTASISALGSDVVAISGTGIGLFVDKNVGTGRAVSLSGYTLSGADAGNYVVQAGSLSADITPASLTVSGVSANHKVYDATPAATLTGTAGVTALGSDLVSVSGTGIGLFADKNVGTGKAVSVSGYTLSGIDAGNYVVVQPGGLSADITQASLTVIGIAAANKVYDTTAMAVLLGTAGVSALGSDIVTVSGTGTGLFADRNVGIAKAVSVSGYTLSGTDAANYMVVQPSGLSADIAAASLAVTGITAGDKVYDTTTSASLAGTASVTALGSDIVSISGAGTGLFADKNVGTGKTVSVIGYSLTGKDAGNYVVGQPSGLSADITPASLTVGGVSAIDKVYDATAAATLAGSASVFALGSDVVSVSGTGTGFFADKNVGTGKTVSVSGFGLTGKDAGNYVVVQPSGLNADITAASLTVSGVTASDKVYDATAAASLAGTASVTALGSDVVSVSGTGTGLFADKNVGTGKAVTVSGYSLFGADAGNYVVVQPGGLSADITPASLTVSGISADDKVYDATTAASLNTTGATLGGLLGSDSVSFDTAGTTGRFADKNVGTSKTVTVSGVALSGADSGNYTVSYPGGVAADITAAALTVSGVAANNKVYDATTVANFDVAGATLAGVIGGDAVSVSGVSGSFADRNVGTAKAVTVAGVSLGGTDAGNYTLANPSGLSADITPASLTVSAIDQTKTQGDSLVFVGTEFTSSGLVGGETIASVTLNSTGAPAPAPVGSYSITAGAAVGRAGFVATNYAISYTPATLLVEPALPAPPAPTPAPAAASTVEQLVALGASPGLARATLAEMSASPLATLTTLLTEEQQQADERREGKDSVVDDNQCRR